MICNLEQLGLHVQQWHLAFGFAHLGSQLFLRADHFARVSVSELQCFHELRFRQLVSGAFDHDDIVFRPDINQIQIALDPYCVGRIRDELAIHAPNPHRADWSFERNV